MKTLLINNSPFLFLNLFLILLYTNAEIFQCITLEKTKFQKMIMKNQKIIQSTRIENYLRKLVLQNNEIGDKDLVFLEKEDLDVNPKDINFILQDDSDEDELRARLFSFKYGKINQKEKNFLTLICDKLHWNSKLYFPSEGYLSSIAFYSANLKRALGSKKDFEHGNLYLFLYSSDLLSFLMVCIW